MHNNFKTNKLFIFAIVIMCILSFTLVSFAFFVPIITNGTTYPITGTTDPDRPDFSFTEINTGINLTGSYPMTTEAGLNTSPYTFTVTNNESSLPIKYEVVLETKSDNTLSDDLISTNIGGLLTSNKTTTVTTSGYTKAYVLNTYVLKATKSKTFDLKIWINENGTISNAQNKTWVGKIIVKASKVYDEVEESEFTLAALNIVPNDGNPNFENIATTDEGVYAMEDDYGTSYYFRGAVKNNYVKFANYYWRIIRINGDGTLRIIFDGFDAHGNNILEQDRYIGTSVYNSASDDNAYVGYMFGLTGVTTDVERCLMLDESSDTVVDNIGTYPTKETCEAANGEWTTTAYEATHANVKSSDIKKYLEEWYKNNILDKGYSEAVADTLFCGDRTLSKVYTPSYGYSNKTSEYFSKNKLDKNLLPTFICPRLSDKYTANDLSNGNGKLKYPIGLITIDEVISAGGSKSNNQTHNNSYYLYKDVPYWTLSPSYFDLIGPKIFIIYYLGKIANMNANISYSVVPVVNLTAETAQQLEGLGTISDPYIVK